MKIIVVTLALTTLVAALMAASAKTPRLPQDPRDVPREAQITVTELRSDLNGDGNQEALEAVNAMTGETDPARGSEVIFGIAAAPAGKTRGALLWSRHVMVETGQPAHDGELTAVDLDGDGRSELILTWDRSLTSLRKERHGEIYSLADLSHPRLIWEGDWERDTRNDTETAPAQREWYRREIDFGATRKEAGQAIVFKKTRDVEAGAKIAPPRVESEWVKVALRAPSGS
jgi:hypothetical protein